MRKVQVNALLLILVLGAAVLAACGTASGQEEPEPIGLANPASVYCEEEGGTLDIRSSDAGEYGVCMFDDGTECEEWAYFRGECAPGDYEAAPIPADSGGE